MFRCGIVQGRLNLKVCSWAFLLCGLLVKYLESVGKGAGNLVLVGVAGKRGEVGKAQILVGLGGGGGWHGISGDMGWRSTVRRSCG